MDVESKELNTIFSVHSAEYNSIHHAIKEIAIEKEIAIHKQTVEEYKMWKLREANKYKRGRTLMLKDNFMSATGLN